MPEAIPKAQAQVSCQCIFFFDYLLHLLSLTISQWGRVIPLNREEISGVDITETVKAGREVRWLGALFENVLQRITTMRVLEYQG